MTPAIQNLIRENKTYRIDSSIQTGRQHGMFLLDDNLFKLWKNGLCEKGRMSVAARRNPPSWPPRSHVGREGSCTKTKTKKTKPRTKKRMMMTTTMRMTTIEVIGEPAA